MKKIILSSVIIFAVNIAFSQTYMKITQGTGFTLSPGNSIDEISFTPTFNCGDVILYGGETYPTVQIGTQCWFAKNLNIGTMIQASENQTNNNIIEKYCYNDFEPNCFTYGAYYRWDEAMQYNSAPASQGICPLGWHIPNDVESITLTTLVNWDPNPLIAIGQGTGTNTSGFSTLFSGTQDNTGNYSGLGEATFFWSSNENDIYAYYLTIGAYGFYMNIYEKEFGFSIRCLKD